MELCHHEAHWPQLRVEVHFIFVSLNVAYNVELILGQIFDGALLLFSDFINLGRELELGITKLELMLPSKT